MRVLEMELLLPTPPPPQGADMLPTPPPPAPTSLPLLFCLVSKASGLLLPSVGRALGMWQFQARPLTLGHHSPTLRHP